MKFNQRNTRAAKLTPSLVAEIRRRYASGEATQGDLSREFGISAVQIGRIVRGESWQQSAPLAAPQQEEATLARLLAVQKETDLLRAKGLDGYGNPLPPSPLDGGEGLPGTDGRAAERMAAEAGVKSPDVLLKELKELSPEVAAKAKAYKGE